MISELYHISNPRPGEQVGTIAENKRTCSSIKLNIFPLILAPAAVRYGGLLHMAYIMRPIQAVPASPLNAE